MTFEEFLLKKKIDPVQLQDADQDFFDEFKSHFIEMGEKSFDHSKKFWFNKLRRAYPLAEVVKIAVAPQAEALESPVAEALEASSFETHKAPVAEAMVTQAEALESPVAEVLETKPTFKPQVAEALEAKANINTSNTEIKNNQVEETETPNSEPTKPTDTAKPAYKPRFKAPPKPADELEVKESGIAPPKEIVDPKPAYRPRFKAGGVKKEEEGE
jgi:hypothetical protein